MRAIIGELRPEAPEPKSTGSTPLPKGDSVARKHPWLDDGG
jgi:hypothetical protein